MITGGNVDPPFPFPPLPELAGTTPMPGTSVLGAMIVVISCLFEVNRDVLVTGLSEASWVPTGNTMIAGVVPVGVDEPSM